MPVSTGSPTRPRKRAKTPGPGSENVSGMTNRPEERLEFRTEARVPEEVRQALVAEVRRRLESGELDSDLAMVETALALLDGDRPV